MSAKTITIEIALENRGAVFMEPHMARRIVYAEKGSRDLSAGKHLLLRTSPLFRVCMAYDKCSGQNQGQEVRRMCVISFSSPLCQNTEERELSDLRYTRINRRHCAGPDCASRNIEQELADKIHIAFDYFVSYSAFGQTTRNQATSESS